MANDPFPASKKKGSVKGGSRGVSRDLSLHPSCNSNLSVDLGLDLCVALNFYFCSDVGFDTGKIKIEIDTSIET